MITYAPILPEAINPSLFAGFIRTQVVSLCWRRCQGAWCIAPDPFVDDWTKEEILTLTQALKDTLSSGGFVLGAFKGRALKGFVSVCPVPLGKNKDMLALKELHVSADCRGAHIGSALFEAAVAFARGQKARKLYISAHSAIETQSFYRAMGCVTARETLPDFVKAEPFDCQLEYSLRTKGSTP